jgi:hypothetical protein
VEIAMPQLRKPDSRPSAPRSGTIAGSAELQHNAWLLVIDEDQKRALMIKAAPE